MSINKPCTSCKLIVYPLEQFRCLDQVWHKRCFRCQRCGMALNMNSYRGYEKKPYCVAHYPQPKRFTVVPDTPELRRVAHNTRVLSNANYHQRFCHAGGLDTRHRPVMTNYHRTLSEGPIHRAPGGYHGNHLMQYNSVGDIHKAECTLHTTNGHRAIHSSHYHSSSDQLEMCENYDDSIEGSYHHCNPDGNTNGSLINEPLSISSINANLKYRTMFDYEAREDDEVSFVEGDIIINGDPITDGWMYGTVQRTGQYGMLPSNYLEVIVT